MLYSNWPHTIYNIDGELLVEAQEKITRAIITRVSKKSSEQNCTILIARTEIKTDLIKVMNQGVYKDIFAHEYVQREILNIINRTEFSIKIIKELERMKVFFPDTYRHLLVVAALSIRISLDLIKEDYDPEKIAQIGFVHDLGKSRIPPNIINKSTPLTKEEFNLIQRHPLLDYILLAHYLHNPKAFVAHATFSHHERLDGSGYPMGAKHINKYVQTIIPCDIFDALVSNRPYRNEPFTARAAIDLLINESRNGRINAKYVFCLISYLRKDKPHYSEVKISQENRDAPPLINNYGKHLA